jgi:hypothetical protein
VTTLEQPPYCADLIAADFYLLPRLESALKGRSCCDANDITKNTTEELKRLPKYWLTGTFPTHLQSLTEVVSLHKGDVLEEM